jgi:tellurite resistance protein
MKTLSQRLPHLPVTAFAMVMGLTGLAIAFGKFYHLQWLPKVPFDIALFLGLGVFVLLSVLYAAKFAMFPGEVAAEFNHPVRTNFFATISISLLLLSIGFHAYWPVLAVSFWWAGTILQTVLALRTMTFWVQHNYEIRHCSPAWFIPVVGNILVPVAGVDFAPKILCYFYFAFGMFFWIALFAIVLYRIIFHPQMPAKFVPTFFILIAPPAVGFISYMRLTASWDPTAIFLLFVAYVFVALLVFMHASFRSLRFYLSWWAFTFPLAAATIASAVAFQITLEPAYKVFAFLLLVATAGVIAIVAFLTGLHACRGEICVPED